MVMPIYICSIPVGYAVMPLLTRLNLIQPEGIVIEAAGLQSLDSSGKYRRRFRVLRKLQCMQRTQKIAGLSKKPCAGLIIRPKRLVDLEDDFEGIQHKACTAGQLLLVVKSTSQSALKVTARSTASPRLLSTIVHFIIVHAMRASLFVAPILHDVNRRC